MSKILNDWERRPAEIYGVGFWNRKPMRGLLSNLPSKPNFHRSFDKALTTAKSNGSSVFAWSSRLTDAQRDECKQAAIPLINVEDGFVRSVGLGAALVPAASLIFDSRGIYYDPSAPSDLEWLLQTTQVTESERIRGANLRKKLIASGVSKYNLGTKGAKDYFPTSRLKILVPGQVSDDAAILKTHSDSLDLKSGKNPNFLLLQRVRAENPDAFILFKPHPDVAKGLRLGGLSKEDVSRFADAEAAHADIVELIGQCDRVETISSLAGFEALLRGKQVYVHGQPFYAGWGATKDFTQIPFRTKLRNVDQLVYLTLIEYAKYVDPVDYRACEAEDVVGALARIRTSKRKKMLGYVNLWIAKIAFKIGM